MTSREQINCMALAMMFAIMAVLQDSTDEELILIAELLEKFHRDHRKG